MKKELSIEELHQIVLNIGKEFHKICVNNNIPYYILAGTMLGAIRHKGFIPWDDDIDIGIPRQYFSKTINLLRKELPSKYSITTIEDEIGVWGEIVKIEDTTTIIKEKDRDTHGKDVGAFIDLFPLDYTKNQNYGRFSHNMLIQRLLAAQQFIIGNDSSSFLAKIYKTIAQIFGRYCFVRAIKYVVKKKGRFITTYCGFGACENVPAEIYGEPVLYKFEDSEFYGLAKPEYYLESLYGNWRELPKEEERHTHLLEMYYKE